MAIEFGSEESRIIALRTSINNLTVKSLFNPRDRNIINQQLRNLSRIAGEMEQRANGKENNNNSKENTSG